MPTHTPLKRIPLDLAYKVMYAIKVTFPRIAESKASGVGPSILTDHNLLSKAACFHWPNAWVESIDPEDKHAHAVHKTDFYQLALPKKDYTLPAGVPFKDGFDLIVITKVGITKGPETWDDISNQCYGLQRKIGESVVLTDWAPDFNGEDVLAHFHRRENRDGAKPTHAAILVDGKSPYTWSGLPRLGYGDPLTPLETIKRVLRIGR